MVHIVFYVRRERSRVAFGYGTYGMSIAFFLSLLTDG